MVPEATRIPESFKAGLRLVKTAKTPRPGRGPGVVPGSLRMALCACPSLSDCFRRP